MCVRACMTCTYVQKTCRGTKMPIGVDWRKNADWSCLGKMPLGKQMPIGKKMPIDKKAD